MNDPAMNNLFRWGVENSKASQNGDAPAAPKTQLDPNAFAALFGGVQAETETEQMARKMTIIKDEENQYTVDQKERAFEDLETLLGQIDNANYLEAEGKGMWTSLVEQLEHKEAKVRSGAAWCAGTAVENNPRAQQRLLALGAIPTLVKLATEDRNKDVRKKAVTALSKASRNFQPGLDVLVDHVPSNFKPNNKLDAGDMSSVDSVIDPLRADAARER